MRLLGIYDIDPIRVYKSKILFTDGIHDFVYVYDWSTGETIQYVYDRRDDFRINKYGLWTLKPREGDYGFKMYLFGSTVCGLNCDVSRGHFYMNDDHIIIESGVRLNIYSYSVVDGVILLTLKCVICMYSSPHDIKLGATSFIAADCIMYHYSYDGDLLNELSIYENHEIVGDVVYKIVHKNNTIVVEAHKTGIKYCVSDDRMWNRMVTGNLLYCNFDDLYVYEM